MGISPISINIMKAFYNVYEIGTTIVVPNSQIQNKRNNIYLTCHQDNTITSTKTTDNIQQNITRKVSQLNLNRLCEKNPGIIKFTKPAKYPLLHLSQLNLKQFIRKEPYDKRFTKAATYFTSSSTTL